MWLLSIGALLALSLHACSSESSDGTEPNAAGYETAEVVNVVPGDPGWRPVVPPDTNFCTGADPGEEAFALSRRIAERAAERAKARLAELDARGEDDGLSTEEDSRSIDDVLSEEGDVVEGSEEPEFTPEPCTPDYLDADACVGHDMPAFEAYDFQPQSCGYGGTYGLDVFKGRVTFVALFASW